MAKTHGTAAGRRETGLTRAVALATSAGLISAGSIAGTARGGTFAHITVDGDVSDWADVVPILVDPAGDTTTKNGSGEVVDFTNVYVANDANYVYIRVELAQPANASQYYTDLLIDGDNNKATGFGAAGAGYAATYAAEGTARGARCTTACPARPPASPPARPPTTMSRGP